LADVKQVDANVRSLTTSIQNFFSGAIRYAASRTLTAEILSEPQVTSNLDWHGSFNLLDFLGTVGIHARVNTMLNRERYKLSVTCRPGYSPSVAACAHVSLRNKVYPSQSLHISYFRHTTSITSTVTTSAQSKLEARISGVTLLQVWNSSARYPPKKEAMKPLVLLRLC